MAAAGNVVGPGDEPKSARARNDIDGSDDSFPSIRRLLSPEYKHKLEEQGSLVQKDTTEKNIGEALDDLFGYGSTAGSSQDKPIVLDSDSRSEHRDDNLDNTYAFSTLDGEQPSHEALDLDILPATFIRSANRLEDGDTDNGDNGIDNSTSRHSAKGLIRLALLRIQFKPYQHAVTSTLRGCGNKQYGKCQRQRF